MSEQASRNWDQETMLVVWLAGCVSILSFFFYLRRGDLLLYGDAVAHINIARRVFDSRTPGLLQLGTVWLPLPHLLMIPFLLSDGLWQSGAGGSIPSLIAYVFGVVGVFRLMRGMLPTNIAAHVAAWLAAVIYAANPNLIYLQATAMTEPLYLALLIWAVVYFSEFVQVVNSVSSAEVQVSPPLMKCGLCLAAACLTRYDGWFLAVAMTGAAAFVVWRAHPAPKTLRGAAAKFLLMAAAAPILWLAYNAIVYRNPLEFANGPYSARAIEQRNSVPGSPSHPGSGSLSVSASYFLKSAELNMAGGSWHRIWLVLLLLGATGIVFFARRFWPLLLLLVTIPFYMLSIAYSGVPIFLPVWWPFSIYNARYGLELLPAFAVFAALVTYWAAGFVSHRKVKAAVFGVSVIFIAASYTSVWHAQPICFREAWVNSRTRLALEKEVANTLKELPSHSTFLMYLGDHVGALQDAGIPLRRVINEGNHRTWEHPSDSEGLWEHALADPPRYVDFVVAFDGDAVSRDAQPTNLSPLVVIHASGQPRAVIYRTIKSPAH